LLFTFSPLQIKNKPHNSDTKHAFIPGSYCMVVNSIFLTPEPGSLEIQHLQPATAGRVSAYAVNTGQQCIIEPATLRRTRVTSWEVPPPTEHNLQKQVLRC
jgi:hypothetical protein